SCFTVHVAIMANRAAVRALFLGLGFSWVPFTLLAAYGANELFDANPSTARMNRSPKRIQRVVTLSASTAQIAQSQSATVTVTTSRANRNRPTAVKYTVGGTAILGTDYQLSGVLGRIVIPAGRTSASLNM